jgi:hypothetical protein
MKDVDIPDYVVRHHDQWAPLREAGMNVALVHHDQCWIVCIGVMGEPDDVKRVFDGELRDDPYAYTYETEHEARHAYAAAVDDLQNWRVPDPLARRHEPPAQIADSETRDAGYDRSAIMRRGHEIARSLGDDKAYTDRLSKGLTQAWAEARPDTNVNPDADTWRGETALAPDPRRLQCDAIEANVPRRSVTDVDMPSELTYDPSGDIQVVLADRGGQSWALFLYHGRILAGRPRRDAVAARREARRLEEKLGQMESFERMRSDFDTGRFGMSVGYATDQHRSAWRKQNPADAEALMEEWDVEDPDLPKRSRPAAGPQRQRDTTPSDASGRAEPATAFA